MLELIIGRDWTANSDEILARIDGDVRQRRGGRILLVPELISHDMERRLCDAAGDQASRYAEVLSFTRLARRVSDAVGHAPMACLDNGGRVVAMAAAARQLHSRLKAYASVETKPEFLTQLVNAVDEFKRCCITAAQLMEASRRCEGALAQKLEELSLLMEAYDALCQLGKRDPRDQMNWVLEELEDSDFAQNRVFYIDGFPDLTGQNMAILEHLIRESEQVTVSLNCDQVSSRLMAFEKAGETAAQIIRCAKRAGVEVRITTVEEKNNALTPMRQYLFQGKLQADESLARRLKLFTADSAYEECVATANRIMELVRGGSRYRQISVVCGNMSNYGPMIGLVFRRMGIPVYLSGTEDILNKGAIVTVLSALDAALDGLEQKAVLRYLRSVLSPISPEDCDLVENYAVIWGISGSRWTEAFENHPEGLSGIWNGYAERTLQRIEQARQLAIGPLVELRAAFRKATKLSEQVMALYEFLERIHLARRLTKLSEELTEAGDLRGAQILDQLWEILLTALEQMYDVLGQTQWDSDAFRRLFILLLSQYDVGTIPAVLDAVTVGPVTAMRCQRCDHLFVLGAEEGSLPGYSGSAGILTDQERDALRRMELSLTGGAMEGIQAEFAEVYGVFCGAKETVSVSCCGQPSYVYRRLAALAGGESVADNSFIPTADAVDAAGILAKFGREDEARRIGLAEEYRQLCAQRDYSFGAVSREHISGLYGNDLTMSASQCDRQAECRLSYFLKYGLRARERKEAAVDPAEFGTYVHDVLENTARDVMEHGGFREVSLEQTLQIAKTHSDAYIAAHFSQLNSQRAEYLFRRNMQELDLVVRELWEELSQAKYDPVDFELHFGKDGKMPAISIPATAMSAALQGYVDRVDVFEVAGVKYFRVVDYKTGKKDFDYCDVFNGVGLQMLLYLFALEQEGEDLLGQKRIAAGVQYFPARVPYENLTGAADSEEKKRRDVWKRRGLLLQDELSLEAMDPSESMFRLSCKRGKEGDLSGDLADREQLRQLRQYVFSLLGKMVDEIASGCVEPNPYTRGESHDACRYCPYKAICHSDSVEGRRNYQAMKASRFWEEIDKEVKSHG